MLSHVRWWRAAPIADCSRSLSALKLAVLVVMLQLAAAARAPPTALDSVVDPILGPLLPGTGIFGPESYPSPPPSHAPSPPLRKPPPPSPPMPPATAGLWSAVIKLPLVPAAGTVITDNVLMTWASYSVLQFTGGPGNHTYTAFTDLTTLKSTLVDVTNIKHDMFCPGIAALSDGRVMVTGGNSDYHTSLFDPKTMKWSVGPQMKTPRGYQSTAAMSDGRVFVIGGSWAGGVGGKNGEVYSNAAGWQTVAGCSVTPMLTADADVSKRDSHAWLFGWKGATVFQAGPSSKMNWYNPGGNATKPAGSRGTDANAMNGNAVMYDAVNGKILTLGGAPNYGNSDATNHANIVTIGAYGTTASVQPLTGMHYPRAYCTSVVLPDGKVLTMGGQMHPIQFTDGTAVFNAEMWDPATGSFTVMAPASVPRNYHSIGLLLPDARVFNGGGGLNGNCNCNHEDGQIYTPPYLLNSDGSLATRPTLTATSRTVVVGGTITVTTNELISKFSLIRRGTVTHALDTDQRLIALTVPFPQIGLSGIGLTFTYTLSVPNDPGVALPGFWYLFAVNRKAGVPSVSWTMQVTA